MKKLLIITISILLLFGFWQSCEAEQDLLIEYPTIPGATKPGQAEEGQELPGLIKYIYLFALGAVGITALIAMLIGAAMYVFSAGNPSKMADAKDRIISAILGIILLLASVLILRTINPDLVEFGLTLPTITPDGGNGNGGGNGGNNACFCINGYNEEEFLQCYSTSNECNSSCADACENDYYACVSFCEMWEDPIDYQECVLYCPISETCRTDTVRCPTGGADGGRWMCIIDVGNAGLGRTGCTSIDQRYLYDLCTATRDDCETHCISRVEEIDPTGNYGTSFRECRRYDSSTECQGYIGCR